MELQIDSSTPNLVRNPSSGSALGNAGRQALGARKLSYQEIREMAQNEIGNPIDIAKRQ